MPSKMPSEDVEAGFLSSTKIQQTFGNRFAVSATEVSLSRKSSAASDLSLPLSPKTLEQPPLIDFYQQTLPKNPGKDERRRPTLTELIHGNEAAADESLEDFEKRNAKIIQAQLKPPKHPETTGTVKIHPSENGSDKAKEGSIKSDKNAGAKKFGWIEGVFVRCCANIFGVMLYLRMAWVAGQAGIIMGSLIIMLGTLITLITALSMSAICTNGQVKGGGAYYLISRSLGPKFGGAIGVIFSIANAVAVAMYVVGFAETIVELLASYGITIIDGGINDVRIIGLTTCCGLLAIIFIGLGFEAKMQIVLLIIVAASILNFYIGAFFPPSEEKKLKGMTGFSTPTLIENLYPSFRNDYYFFSVFAIYFPAATGIMAGANISGDLKNSTTAIPKGTILAIFATTFVYLSVVWICGASVIRDADGVMLPTLLETPTTITSNGWWISSIFSSIFGKGTQYFAKPDCVFDNNKQCEYGIMNDFQTVNLVALWSPLVVAGILTSTLSSALLSLVSAPKVFQAVAQDKLFPYIDYFSTGFNNNPEPQKAYIFAFIISCLVVLVGNLNAIAPIISNFYLSTYILINFACFDTSFARAPGFRPSFKYYNQWISLLGAILCVCVMFVISYVNALITFLFFGLLFLYMSHRKPDVNWGSSNQAHAYRNALQYAQKLENINEHVKNYRPQILVLSGNPAARPPLVDFAHAITKDNSLLICGHVLPYTYSGSINQLIDKITPQIRLWFHRRHLKAFYLPTANDDFRHGVQCLLQGSGLGKMKPNILFIGFKQNWNLKDEIGLKEINDYFNIIQDAFDSEMGVCVLRNAKNGFDFSELMDEKELPMIPKAEKFVEKSEKRSEWNAKSIKAFNSLRFKKSSTIMDAAGKKQSIISMDPFPEGNRRNEGRNTISGSESDSDISLTGFDMMRLAKHFNPDQIQILTAINRFQFKVIKGTIDVWWLYDDGGLSLLIPYLLTQKKSYLEGAKLRIFTLSSQSKIIEEEQKKLAALLSKFRINFAEVKVIKDDGRKPNIESILEFEKLIEPFCVDSSDLSESKKEGLIQESELSLNQEKTWRTLRMAENLQKHSSESDLIVV
uniref:Uncharacterized protein n=1 Tax=Panagrolaimus superbus TaxID=310955 RepID=A0A914Z7T2_9BILA